MLQIKSFFKKIWHGWTVVIKFIGEVNGTILLTLLMIVVLFPIKLVLMLTGRLPIPKFFRSKDSSYWIQKQTRAGSSISTQY